MNLDDIKGKAEELKNSLLTEENTDAALDTVADAAKKVLPGQEDKIDAARDAIDEKLGQ